ncbi:MAG: CvpA family protein [Bacteroides sp.]|jgi:membrane protein required for colicin V production|nr:CvpA family protein [Bacteroides sp.]
MNYIDLIIAIPLLWGAIRGFSHGFLMEVATLAGLIGGIFVALIAADVAGRILAGMVDWNPIPFKFFAFVVAFILVVILLKFLAKVLENVFKAIHLNLLNRLGGLVFGIIKFAFILSILMIFVNYLNPHIELLSEKAREGSLLLPYIEKMVHYILPAKEFIPLPQSWSV